MVLKVISEAVCRILEVPVVGMAVLPIAPPCAGLLNGVERGRKFTLVVPTYKTDEYPKQNSTIYLFFGMSMKFFCGIKEIDVLLKSSAIVLRCAPWVLPRKRALMKRIQKKTYLSTTALPQTENLPRKWTSFNFMAYL